MHTPLLPILSPSLSCTFLLTCSPPTPELALIPLASQEAGEAREEKMVDKQVADEYDDVSTPLLPLLPFLPLLPLASLPTA
jgi:hypothetical protein